MDVQSISAVIRHCVASDEYRDQHKEQFAQALACVEPATMDRVMRQFHLLPLLYAEIQRAGIDSPLAELIHPYIILQRIFCRMLQSELERIRSAVDATGVRPVVLKGPAYWNRLYPKPWMRPVTDLDLLIPVVDQVEEVCDCLSHLGYVNEFDDYKSMIEKTDHYSIPSFHRSRTEPVSAEEASALDHLLADDTWGSVLKKEGSWHGVMRREAADRYSFTVEVEIHKSIYVLKGFTFPEISDDLCEESATLPGFRVLRPIADLPYLATKFANDVRLKKTIAAKLVADFVRILGGISQDEVGQSIEIAYQWSSAHNYLLMLRGAQRLMPEVDLEGIDSDLPDPLEALINLYFDELGAPH